MNSSISNEVPVNSTEYLSIRREYTLLTGQDRESKFIGGMPVTLERDCIRPILRKSNGVYQYFFTLKADGERVLIFTNRSGNMFFIRRSMQIYSTGLEYTPNCLFDAEYLSNNLILVFDCLYSNSKSLLGDDYYTRSGKIPTDIPNFYPKRWFNLSEVMSMPGDPYAIIIKESQIKGYNKIESDGVIIQPFDTPYVPFGPWITKNNVQYKWKPVDSQTIDFRIKYVSGSVWALITRNGNPLMINVNNKPEPALCRPTEKNKREYPDGSVAEFKLVKDNLFKVYKPRPNKEPNTIPTAMSVLNFLQNPFGLNIFKGINNQEYSLSLIPKSNLILEIMYRYPGAIIFSQSEMAILSNVYSRLGKESEFEIRLSKSGGKGVKKYSFDNIFRYLYSKYPFGVINTMDIIKGDTRSEYINTNNDLIFNGSLTKKRYELYSENTEEISTISKFARNSMILIDPQEIRSNISTLKKTNKYSPVDFNGIYYKFGLSRETKGSTVIQEIEYPKSNFVRFKNRHSFFIGTEWRIDLTIVKEGYGIKGALDSFDTYEVEIEYIINNNNIPEQQFIYSASKVLTEVLIKSNNC